MKKSLPCMFLALTIFSLNALPAQAIQQEKQSIKDQKELAQQPGQFCFELPLMGIFCYDL